MAWISETSMVQTPGIHAHIFCLKTVDLLASFRKFLLANLLALFRDVDLDRRSNYLVRSLFGESHALRNPPQFATGELVWLRFAKLRVLQIFRSTAVFGILLTILPSPRLQLFKPHLHPITVANVGGLVAINSV